LYTRGRLVGIYAAEEGDKDVVPGQKEKQKMKRRRRPRPTKPVAEEEMVVVDRAETSGRPTKARARNEEGRS
jgi:hypothetical protein